MKKFLRLSLIFSLLVMTAQVVNAATTTFTVNFKTNNPAAATWKINIATSSHIGGEDVTPNWDAEPGADGLYSGTIYVPDAYYTVLLSKSVYVDVIPNDTYWFYSSSGDFTYNDEPIQKNGLLYSGVRLGSYQINKNNTNQVKNYTVYLYPKVTTEYHKTVNVNVDSEAASVTWAANGEAQSFTDGAASYTSTYSVTMIHDYKKAESGALDFANALSLTPAEGKVVDYTLTKGDEEYASATYVAATTDVYAWNTADSEADVETYTLTVTESVEPEREPMVTLYTEGMNFDDNGQPSTLAYSIARATGYQMALDPEDGYTYVDHNEAENPVKMSFAQAQQPENLYVYLNGNLIINGNPDTEVNQTEWTGNLHQGDVVKVIYNHQAAEGGQYALVDVPTLHSVDFTTSDFIIKPDVVMDYTRQISSHDLGEEYENWSDGLNAEVLANTVFELRPHLYFDEDGKPWTSVIKEVRIFDATATPAAQADESDTENPEDTPYTLVKPDEDGIVTFTVSSPVNVQIVGNLQVTGIDSVNAAPVQDTDSRVYNLQGIEVNGKLTPGLYIQAGRKFMVK